MNVSSHLISPFSHKIGSHCGSTLMRDILQFYGYNLTEELCFGIGSGLGFVYRKSWDPPLYMVLGRGQDLEEKIGEHMGFFTATNITYDNETAWHDVKAMIDSNTPVLLDIDASLIDYLKERFNLFEHVRYGGHRVCLLGYNMASSNVIVADYAWQELKKIDFSTFSAARSSDIGEFPSRNLWYRFYFPQKTLSIEESIARGIGFTVHNMLYPPNRQSGLQGMLKFVRQVRLWPYESTDNAHVMKNAYIAYMMLETVGTGGGNFRRIYARFLREAAKILKEPLLEQLSQTYFGLAKEWSKIAKLLLESSKNIESGIFDKNNSSLQTCLNDVYKTEEESVHKLQNVVERTGFVYSFMKAC